MLVQPCSAAGKAKTGNEIDPTTEQGCNGQRDGAIAASCRWQNAGLWQRAHVAPSDELEVPEDRRPAKLQGGADTGGAARQTGTATQ